MNVKLLSGALGAEISGIDLTDTSDQNFKKINDLLLEHKVIFFRDQPLTTDQHIALAEKFGPLSLVFLLHIQQLFYDLDQYTKIKLQL